MKNKIISVLTVAFAVFFMVFVVRITDNLSNAKRNLLSSPNIIDVTNIINTKLFITDDMHAPEGAWTKSEFNDAIWETIKIPSYQIIQNKNFREGNYAYYRIKLPHRAFKQLKNLKFESSIALQYIFFSQIDVFINGEFYRTFKPKNSIEANVVLPVIEGQDNVIGLKGHIKSGDTGIDHRDQILLGSGVELNALHSLSYKVQTVFQLIFILCKGSILFIFALIYLLLKVETSFEKFFIFGLCAVVEELIAGEYLYGPLNFNQMVYLYNFVNFGGAIAVFLFFAELNNLQINKHALRISSVLLLVASNFLALDALYWNYLVDLTIFMKFWNLLFVGIMLFYIPMAFKRDRILFFILCTAASLYIWGALFAVNIGLNFKAYGNLLLFIMVAYQTFVIFRREQEQLQLKERMLSEQEKDVAIGRTASLLAHDIRKPLEQMKLIFEKITSDGIDENFLEIAKKDLDISISGVDQQVNDIINYSKTSKISLVEISFYRTLSHALKQIMSIHQEMNIEIEYDFRAQTKILGDQARLSVALVNLIANAVEAIRDLGNRYDGKIRLSTFLTGSDFKFAIFNDGPEIPNQIIQDIFKPLFTQGKANGTGLGLASVVKTIKEHNGSINVQNKFGQGVEFTLTFARGFETDDSNSYSFQSTSKSYNYQIAVSKIDSPPKYRALAIEKDPFVIQKINSMINTISKDIRLTIASEKSEVIELMDKSRYDFYLLNVNLIGSSILSDKLSYLSKELILYSDSLPANLQEIVNECISNRKRVLFVDDTKLFRIAWQMFHGDHNILCLDSPEEALTQLNQKNFNPDVVVLDYYFSNSSMGGLTLARKIREILPGILVLICSSVDQEITEFKTIGKKDYDIRKFSI